MLTLPAARDKQRRPEHDLFDREAQQTIAELENLPKPEAQDECKNDRSGVAKFDGHSFLLPLIAEARVGKTQHLDRQRPV